MELTTYILDTNIALYFLGGLLRDPLPEGQYFVSTITEMELLSYSNLQSNEEQKINCTLTSNFAV